MHAIKLNHDRTRAAVEPLLAADFRDLLSPMSVEVKLMYLPEHRDEGGASKLRWAQRSYSAPQ